MTTTLVTRGNVPDPWGAPWAPADPEAYCAELVHGDDAYRGPEEVEADPVAGDVQAARRAVRQSGAQLSALIEEATGVNLNLPDRVMPHPLADDLRDAIDLERGALDDNELDRRPVAPPVVYSQADIRRMRRKVKASPSDRPMGRRRRYIAMKAGKLGITFDEAAKLTPRRRRRATTGPQQPSTA